MGCGASAQSLNDARFQRLQKIADVVRSKIDGKVDGKSLDRDARVALCFKEWDVDSSGGISVNELLKIFIHCDVTVEMHDIRCLWSLTDTNSDSQIDLQEFIRWLYADSSTLALPRDPTGSWPARAPQTPTKSSALDDGPLQSTRREPLIVFLHSAVALPSGSKECSPDVIAFVSKSDKVVGPQVSWPAFKHNNNPCWNTARDLGCQTMGPGADDKSILHLQVRGTVEGMFSESHVLLGELCLSLASHQQLQLDEWQDLPLKTTSGVVKKDTDQKEAPSLRFMIMSEPPLTKKIFLVRHAESLWNKAQREKNISALLEQVDHPLTKVGLEQCLNLQKKLVAALQASGKERELSRSEVELLDAQLVLSSPLTRAIETALIGLHPILAKLKSLGLMANAREKRNRGGRDTSGSAKGMAETFYRLRQVLTSVGTSEDDISRYLSVNVDTTEADNKWWNDSKESSSAVQERLDEFLRQLRYLREERIVVVGHSHFFRALLQQRLHSSAEVVGATRSAARTLKLANCSVMAATLDFRKGSDRPITKVELLFDTSMESK